jgi:hypothetical protein
MMGRAVFVLCLLVGAANACPPDVEGKAQLVAHLEATAEPPAAMLHSTEVNDDAQGLAVALALMGLCGFAFVLTRANAVRRTFATSRHMVESDLDVLKHVSEAQRGRTAAFVVVCAFVLAIVTALPLELGTSVMLSAPLTMLLAAGVIGLCRLQLLLELQPEPSLRVMSHGHHLFAARGKRLIGWVAAPPSVVARASRLPVATMLRS